MKNLLALINFTWNCHTTRPTLPKKAFRKWDGVTPYAIHPLWCAMTILTETSLREEVRTRGAEALLLHDVLEDTHNFLPHDTDRRVCELVKEMTHESFSAEMKVLDEMSDEVKLLKLYDKVSNLLDATWMTPEKRTQYVEWVKTLAKEVEKVYGSKLNILAMVRAIT